MKTAKKQTTQVIHSSSRAEPRDLTPLRAIYINFWQSHKNKIIKVLTFLVFLTSIILGIHNASLYNPTNGFDGSGHIYYVKYIADNRQIPPPTEYETHQPPVYYIISAAVLSIFRDIKSIQYVNIAVLWMIILVVGLGIQKIFKDRNLTLLGMLSLAALPMLNIFQSTVTNELLNTFWIISAVVSCIFLSQATNSKELNKAFFYLLLSLSLGIWTKITIITILPTVFVALFLSLRDLKRFLVYGTITVVIFVLAYTPIYLRAANTSSPSNIASQTTMLASKGNQRSLDFYYRLDWIPKMDMYNTQYYSLLGGAWNSFFTDGHNVITPFVPFHKKAFILWSLGFLLLPLSLYGLWRQWKENRNITIVLSLLGLSMLGFYFLYNVVSNHYSAARLTYQMAIVLPYAFGLVGTAKNKKLFPLIFLLLFIQFAIMVSFFWIEPWWFVTRPKVL